MRRTAPYGRHPVDKYAVVNLMDLDNVLAGRAVGEEARFARPRLESQGYRGEPLPLRTRCSLVDRPPARGAGGGLCDRVRLRTHAAGRGGRRPAPWDVVRVAPTVVRAFEAGPEGMDIVAIGGPRPAESDGEFVEVKWPE